MRERLLTAILTAMAVWPASASASAVIVTQPATNITATTAQTNGYSGCPGICASRFALGTSPGNLPYVNPSTVVHSHNYVAWSTTWRNLQPGTQYWFKLEVNSPETGNRWTSGREQTFVTPR